MGLICEELGERVVDDMIKLYCINIELITICVLYIHSRVLINRDKYIINNREPRDFYVAVRWIDTV